MSQTGLRAPVSKGDRLPGAGEARHTTAAGRRPSNDMPCSAADTRWRLVSKHRAWPELRNGTLSLLDQAVVSATSFATVLIIGRLCSQEQLGVFYLAMTIVFLAKAIQDTIISAPYVVYCHSRQDIGRTVYSGSALIHSFGLSAVTLLVLASILGLLAIGVGPTELRPILWVLFWALPFLQLREFIRRLVIAHLRMRTAILIDVSVAVLQIGSLLALAYTDRLTVTIAYSAMGAACALACCGWLIGARRTVQLDWSSAVADWSHNWRFARWALASHLIGFATLYITPWIVSAACGSAEAGILAACVSIVGVSSMFMTGLATFLTPRAAMAFAQSGVGQLRRVLGLATAVYVGVLGIFALLAFLFGDSLLLLAFSAKYASYGTVLGVLALSTLALSVGLTAGIGLWAIDRPEANLVADVCTLVVTLAVVLALIQSLGALGAALGDLAGKTVGATIRQWTLRRLLASLQPSLAL